MPGRSPRRHSGKGQKLTRRHSGEGPSAWMQVVEQRLEQAAEESSGLFKTFPPERECPLSASGLCQHDIA